VRGDRDIVIACGAPILHVSDGHCIRASIDVRVEDIGHCFRMTSSSCTGCRSSSNERLKEALGTPNFPQGDEVAAAAAVTSAPVAEADLADVDGTETTLRESRAIRSSVPSSAARSNPRVVQRDAKSSFAALLDDNNRKPIARLHFNRTQKYIGLFGADKEETRVPIGSSKRFTSTPKP
jgi:hypothetical protein